ncbi:MAG TPA: tripartite tricarboxylate transporter substrate binding protein [Burkholderiales bacterium]|nr:tripartite tricarboxylate transporter substrate binding protein [Burkholderiales bacterium]
MTSGQRLGAAFATLLAFFGGFGAAGAYAQAYPAKPIRLIVGFPPGGGSDALARLLGGGLTEKLGQQVLVDNKAGANTIVATQWVQSQPADGYTLLFVSASFAINPSLYKLTYDIEKDFTPAAIVAIVPLLLVVPNEVPVKSVKDLIALAKSQPGKLTYASFGTGSAAHLAGEMLLHMTGSNMIHVPYKGSAPAIADVMGNRVTMMLPGIGSAINLAKDGKLRALAVSTAKRASGAPDIPTIAESGVPGFDIGTWESVQAPAGTPADVIARLNTAIREVVADKALRAKMINLGFEPDAMKSPAEAAQFVRSERKKMGGIVRERNIKVE